MSILLCVSIAWVAFCLLFVGLGLIFLLIVEHFSTSQVTIDGEGISDQAPQMAKLDRAMDEPIQKMRELLDACDARAQLEDAVTLAPRDANLMGHSRVAHHVPRTGAVIIRDPRLTRARSLSDQGGGAAEETVARTSATQEIGASSKAMEVLPAEVRYQEEQTSGGGLPVTAPSLG